MENRYLLSEPEASEPVADSPLKSLLRGLCVSNESHLWRDEWAVKSYVRGRFFLVDFFIRSTYKTP
jgi:hypothetical protein